jgi:hypothetical protein
MSARRHRAPNRHFAETTMLRWPTAVLLAVIVAAGCTQLPKNTALLPGTSASDHVALEVFFVRIPLDDQAVLGPLYSEIDEQAIPLPTRRRLAENGFIVGQVGGQLPDVVSDLLKVSDDAPTPDPRQATVLDVTKPVPVRRKRIDIYQVETPNRIVVTGDRQRHEKLIVLYRDEVDETQAVCGWTFANARGSLLTKVHPQSDGRVQLDLVPEVEYGEEQSKVTPQEGGAWTVVSALPHKSFDGLRINAKLSPGEMLIMTCQGDRPGSLGQQFFTERQDDAPHQIVLMIRVVQGKADDLFTNQPHDEVVQ